MTQANQCLRLARLGWLILIGILLPTTVGAQARWTQYTDFTSITSLAESRHHLWVGTNGGLVRVDKRTGEKFYFDRAYSHLIDTRILVMETNAKGRLAYINRMGALVEIEGETRIQTGASAPLQGQFPFDLAWNTEGVLFVLTFDRLTRLPAVFIRRENQWLSVPLEGASKFQFYSPSGLSQTGVMAGYGSVIPYLQVDEQGRALVLTSDINPKKLYRISAEGAVDTLPIPEHLGPILYLQPKSGSPYWLCHGMLAKPSPGGWDSIPYPSLFPKEGYNLPAVHPRHMLARMPDGTEYWSFRRLFKYQAGTWSKDSIPGDGSPYAPLLLLASGQGDTTSTGSPYLFTARGDWVGSLLGQDWTVTDISTKPLGPNSWRIGNILPLRDGTSEILMTTDRGAEIFEPQLIRSTPIQFDTASGNIRPYGLGLAPDGRPWIMSQNGLTRLGTEGPQTLKADDQPWVLPDHWHSGSGFFTTDINKNFWAATKGRLIAIPGGTTDTRNWKMHELPASERNADLFSPSGHPDGSVWFSLSKRGTSEEQGHIHIGRYDGQTWRFFDFDDHPWLARLSPPAIQCDSSGNVWARFNEGLLQWNGTAWKDHARGSSPFFPNGFHAITIDPKGQFWTATAQPDAMLLRWEGQWVPITESRDVIGGSQIESMHFDASGRLWMASQYDGVFVYDPSGAITTSNHAMQNAPGRKSRFSLMRRSEINKPWTMGVIPHGGDRLFDLRGRQIGLPFQKGIDLGK